MNKCLDEQDSWVVQQLIQVDCRAATVDSNAVRQIDSYATVFRQLDSRQLRQLEN